MPKIMLKGEEVEIEFYREDIKADLCWDADCSKSATYVSMDDNDEVICNTHRLDLPPGERRRYIKIEDVPFKNPPRSEAERAFNGDDDEYDPDEYELDDEDLPPNAGSAS